MSQVPMWRRYLRFLGADPKSDLDDELRLHLELRAEKLARQGMAPSDARAEALRRFGNLEAVRNECERIDSRIERRRRLRTWMDGLRQDARYAARTLRKNPVFTLVAATTLALGVGANATMFAIMDALFLRPPAGVSRPAEVVQLHVVRRTGNITTPEGGPGSYPDYEALRGERAAFSAVSAYFFPRTVDVGRGERATQAVGQVVTPGWFAVLGVRPHRGRFFVEEEGRAGAAPAAVLSHLYWRRAHGGDPSVVGKTLLVNGVPTPVVGVAAPGFVGIDDKAADLWMASGAAAQLGVAFDGWNEMHAAAMLRFIARLAPGVEAPAGASAASARLRAAADQSPELDPEPGVIASGLSPASGPNRTRVADVALWLAFATGLVLIVACANVANLLLARVTARRREIAVRVALGVGRVRLVRALMMESLLVAALGGLLAVGMIALLLSAVRSLPLPPDAATLHPRVLGFTAAMVLVTTLLIGCGPALRMAHADPAANLRDGSSSEPRRHSRIRTALLGAQVALAVLSIAGAGLFVRSLLRVTAVDLGVELDHIAVVSVDVKQARFGSDRQRSFYRTAMERLRHVPGVRGASVASEPPLSGSGSSQSLAAANGEPISSTGEGPYFITVSEEYFRTTGVRIAQGRPFLAEDRSGARPVAIVNRSLAGLITPGRSPVGECIRVGKQVKEGGCTEIVGVAEDNLHRLLDARPVPYLFRPETDAPGTAIGRRVILVRTAGDADAALSRIQRAVQSMEPDLPFVEVKALPDLIRNDLVPFRLGAYLSAAFGGLALLITAVGLYGVLAYLIAQRTREIGIRRSLGASNGHLVRLVASNAAVPAGFGALAGVLASLAVLRLIGSLLYSTAPQDPIAIAAAVVLVALTAALAAYVPARRALRVDPGVALRNE